MRINRIVFCERAPFHKLDLDLSNNQIISLTGINGSGKTSILSHIVDAFFEIARKTFGNEFSGEKAGKLYRISSQLYNMDSASDSFVYILFECGGKNLHYIDIQGVIDESEFNRLFSKLWKDSEPTSWPVNYNAIRHQYRNGSKHAKYLNIVEDEARDIFTNNILTYFPSYRYEQPGYLNDVFQMQMSYRCKSDSNGYFINPIEVTSNLPQIANWMMDVVLDNELYRDSIAINNLQQLVSNILMSKLKKPVRLGIGPRNFGGARIQIVDALTRERIYPTIFNISSGEASLLCLFGELIKQADKLRKNISDVGGIVIVDEIDKHLHIVLQREVLPTLMQMFPKLQFIISTHSAFVNIGLTDLYKDSCRIIDLDSGGIECSANRNEVFREAYNVMIEENDRYLYFLNSLREKVENAKKPVLYLEGPTDEKYFKKAAEIYGYADRIDIQWIGHLDSKGNDVFTGSGGLNSGIQFVKGRTFNTLQFFLYDCDTKREESDEGNIIVMTMPYYDSHIVMNKGIENALELDNIDLENFYEEREEKKDYGNTIKRREFNKMKMCTYICEMEEDVQKDIFVNIKQAIERIIARIEKENVDIAAK